MCLSFNHVYLLEKNITRENKTLFGIKLAQIIAELFYHTSSRNLLLTKSEALICANQMILINMGQYPVYVLLETLFGPMYAYIDLFLDHVHWIYV